MKHTKILLTAVMLVMMLGLTASAADQKVTMTKDADGTYNYVGMNVDSADSIYHKITVPKAGLLYIVGNGFTANDYNNPDDITYSEMYVHVYNKKMKLLDNIYRFTDAVDEQYVIYGVKKGTYYLKTSGHTNYVLAAVFQPVTNKGGSSKAKAYSLPRGKYIEGVMPVGEKLKTSDWYKFQVKKKKVIRIDVDCFSNDSMDFYLYGPSYKKGIPICSLTDGVYTYQSKKIKNNKKLKVKPGTYYIRVKRTSNAKASGVYALKWK